MRIMRAGRAFVVCYRCHSPPLCAKEQNNEIKNVMNIKHHHKGFSLFLFKPQPNDVSIIYCRFNKDCCVSCIEFSIIRCGIEQK
jgi:hypothetical protein